MVDKLKTFAEGERLKASDTNSNNLYLLGRISNNYTKLKTWLDGEVGRINSNIQSGDATLQATLDTLQETLNTLNTNFFRNLSPDYSKGSSVPYPTSGNKYTAPNYGIYVTNLYRNQDTVTLYINGTATSYVAADYADGASYGTFTIPLSKGDVIYWNKAATTVIASMFYPYKGV